ncbi:MAG: 4a-hydroxytetrahydrobiopterin dehydratase [Myxococcales bacterium]|nr:4a-hydroxytetrahydrobiopterin dehydratase [Myxococcales bacterium]
MSVAPLPPARRAEALALLPAWLLVDDGRAIERRWVFADFSQAWAFLSRVALLAEAQGHHPDWHNAYNRVTVRLTTHDCGGLSERDVRLAHAIDGL